MDGPIFAAEMEVSGKLTQRKQSSAEIEKRADCQKQRAENHHRAPDLLCVHRVPLPVEISSSILYSYIIAQQGNKVKK